MCNTCPVLVPMASTEHSCPQRQHSHTYRLSGGAAGLCMYHEGVELLALSLTIGCSCRQRRDPNSKCSESLGLLAKIVGTSANSPENRYECATPTVCSASLGACARGVPWNAGATESALLQKSSDRLPASQDLKTLCLGSGAVQGSWHCWSYLTSAVVWLPLHTQEFCCLWPSQLVTRTPSLGVSMLTGIAFSTGRPTYREPDLSALAHGRPVHLVQ